MKMRYERNMTFFSAITLIVTIAIGTWLAVELIPKLHIVAPIVAGMLIYSAMLVGETLAVIFYIAGWVCEKDKEKMRGQKECTKKDEREQR